MNSCIKNNYGITSQTDTTIVIKPHTFGAGSFGLHSAGNISFNLSFSVFGLTKASEAENGWICLVYIGIT